MFTERQERLTSDLRGEKKQRQEKRTETERKGDTRGYMIAGQTHKSSINPQGAKDALFSSNRQPSQTEHHHKTYTPSFPLRCAPTVCPVLLYGSFSTPFPCFLILLSFLNITDKELYKIRTPFTPLFLTRPASSKIEPAWTWRCRQLITHS